jgi:plastocyanin
MTMHLRIAAALLAVPLALGFIAAPAAAAEHAVSIEGMKFSPATLSVAAGDTVTFTNNDSAPHTATAAGGAFDTGRLANGESATVTISAAGTHDYICQIHPSMKGVIEAQ